MVTAIIQSRLKSLVFIFLSQYLSRPKIEYYKNILTVDSRQHHLNYSSFRVPRWQQKPKKSENKIFKSTILLVF